MNLSFSNRGWSGLSWSELLALAREQGFSGIELYNLHRSPLSAPGGPLHPAAQSAALRALREQGLDIPCLDSSIDLSDASGAPLSACRDLLELAAGLHVPYVAVKVMQDSDALEAALAELSALAE